MTAKAIKASHFDNPYIEALLTGRQWRPGDTLTYYLQPSDEDHNGVNDWSQNGIELAFRVAYASWSSVANIKVKEITDSSSANYVEKIVFDGTNEWSHSTPERGQGGGKYDFESAIKHPEGFSIGGIYFQSLVHEVGHALGLKHPFSLPAFPGVDPNTTDEGDNGLNNTLYTVMSYTDHRDVVGTSGAFGWGFIGTPMASHDGAPSVP